MSKEIKEEKSKLGAIIAIVAIAVIAGGIMIFKPNSNTTTQKQDNTVAAKVEPKEEKAMARIDITTELVDAKKPQFEVYVDGADRPLRQENWMPKYDIQGSITQKDSGKIDILIKVLSDSDISISLKGIWDKNANGKLIEHWVKYTVFTINDVDILTEPTEVWHNKPFTHTIDAEANDEYKVHIEWSKADK